MIANNNEEKTVNQPVESGKTWRCKTCDTPPQQGQESLAAHLTDAHPNWGDIVVTEKERYEAPCPHAGPPTTVPCRVCERGGASTPRGR